MTTGILPAVLSMSAAGTALYLAGRCLERFKGHSAGRCRGLYLTALAAFLIPIGVLLRGAGPGAYAPSTAGLAGGTLGLPVGGGAIAMGWSPHRQVWELVFLLWLAGALLVGALALARQVRFRLWLSRRRAAEEDPERLELLRIRLQEAGVRRRVKLYRTPGLSTPLGVGLLSPEIYLPQVPMSPEETDFVLRHEAAHIAHWDLGLQWAGLLAGAVHWWNPAVWLTLGRLGFWCEAACDEAVYRGLDPAGRRRYGAAILDVLSRSAGPAGGVYSALGGASRGMERRLKRILDGPRARGRRWVPLGLALFLAVLPLAGGAHAWARAKLPAETSREVYQSWAVWHNRAYEPLGVFYDGAADRFTYQGARVSVLADARPLTDNVREVDPWVTLVWELLFVDNAHRDGVGLRTVRDSAGTLVGLEVLSREETAAFYNGEGDPVTFNGWNNIQGSLYSMDLMPEDLTGPVSDWVRSVPSGQAAVFWEESAGEQSGYLCFPDGHYPWRAVIQGETLEVSLFRVTERRAEEPTVIQFTALEPFTQVAVWLDGKPVPVTD